MEVFPGSSKLVNDEVPRGIYLVSGPSGSGKTSFCKNFVASGLKRGEPCIYLTTDEACERVEESLLKMVEPTSLVKTLTRVVDSYSWRLGAPKTKQYSVSPSNLMEVGMTCERACDGFERPLFVLDSISVLASHSSPETALKFVQVVTAKMRQKNAFGFFTLIPLSHDEKFLQLLRSMFDGILEFRIDESGIEISRLLRVYSIKGVSHSTAWFPITIHAGFMRVNVGENPRCAWCGGVIEYEPYPTTVRGKKYTFHAKECAAKFIHSLETASS